MELMGKEGGCWFSRIAITKYLKLGGLKQQTFILMVLEGRCPKSRCP